MRLKDLKTQVKPLSIIPEPTMFGLMVYVVDGAQYLSYSEAKKAQDAELKARIAKILKGK